MKASQIARALEQLIESKQPVFLWGPPGVGKSQVVSQTAVRLGVQLIDIRAILLDPVDLRGLPKISSEGVSQWCVPAFLPRSGEGILFLDELNAAPPLVQAACYQLVLDRKLGEYELPAGWSIIAAGNRETDRAVTHRMPSALANRFVHLDFDVDFEEWLAWAKKVGITAEVIAFLRFRPALLHDFDPDKSGKAFPTPRSWEFASRIIAGARYPDLLTEMLTGTVGRGAASEFAGFMKTWQELPDPQEIIAHPDTVQIPADPAVLFAICELMGRIATMDNREKLLCFADRLPSEFSVLLVREAVRHCAELAGSEDFARWAVRHANVLV